ncbi:elongation factor 1-gamma [Biomphalaria pfeifferi]|uniref:Elongation factor 1-gamma n=1 Tax=Biomphalaria pfeifferi TaxID=112525 RepID=A0AAD8AT51_BIOPF|nr:elongation factor 1-gamma [Biomphalaria pfeifferi]
MASGTLYTYPQSFRANKALIAAQYSGADVKLDSKFKFGETNKSAEFLKKFPIGKVPAFEGLDGFVLSESNAIAYYVSNSQLHGENSKDAALVQQWISFSDNEILPAACTWVFPCLGITQFNKQDTDRAKEQIKKVLSILNDHFLTRTFAVGERVTLADISLVCNLQSLYEQVLDPEFRKPYQNVNRWFNTVVNQPQVKKVLGEVKLASKIATFDAKKYQEIHGSTSTGGAGDSKKKEKKPAQPQAQQPKKEKEKPAPKSATVADEEEGDEPKQESKDPFAALPKGTMNLDEFKRVYSNQDILTEAIPYFWKNFDKENYSLWYCEYNQNLEGKMSFMVSNLVEGMFQRLDKFRKNAFGSMIVFGESKKNSIAGLWFWRYPELAFTLSPDWMVDYESYTWKKLDPGSDEAKDLVQKFFLQDGDFGGKVVADGKIFK